MFRFTIRDVLLGMVIVGLALGWWIDHRRQDARYREQALAAAAYFGLNAILEERGYRVDVAPRSVTLSGGAEREATRITLIELDD